MWLHVTRFQGQFDRRTFKPLSEAPAAEILGRNAASAQDGKYELYKSILKKGFYSDARDGSGPREVAVD
jgi:hypothetical protein